MIKRTIVKGVAVGGPLFVIRHSIDILVVADIMSKEMGHGMYWAAFAAGLVVVVVHEATVREKTTKEVATAEMETNHVN